MLYQVSFDVDSYAIYHQPYIVEVDGFIVEVVLSDELLTLSQDEAVHSYQELPSSKPQKTIKGVKISKRVENYKDFLPELSMELDSQTLQIGIRDLALLNQIVELAQHLEAIGSYWLRIHKIHWESPIRTWVPETPEEEKDSLSAVSLINNFQSTASEKKSYVEAAPSMLASIISNRSLHKHLVLPMSFYREGCHDFLTGRYTRSFINFYFYMDDLYGRGKTKNKAVEKELKESYHIRRAFDAVIEDFNDEENSLNIVELNQFLFKEGKSLTVDSLIELVVQVRGNLSHFSQRSRKKKGHPLNQRDFRVMALLMKSICVYTFSELTTEEQPK